MPEFSTGGAVVGIAGGLTLAGVLEYFHLSGEVTAIFATLLILDFIFGIVDAYIEDKQQVTSAKMWRGLVKKCSKFLLPLIVVLVLKGIGFENLDMVVTTIFSILLVTEGYSIIGHIYCLNSGEHLSEIDAFSLLIDFIIGIFKQKLPKNDKGEDLDEE